MFVPLEILKALLSSKYKIVNGIGIFLSIGAVVYCVILLFTSAALMGIEESNKWSVAYILSFLLDTFII